MLFQASSKVLVSLDMLPVGWLELGSVLQDLQGVLGVLAPGVLAGPECADRQGVIREREGRVADREAEELVKGWLVATWIVLVASFNPGVFQGTREVVGIADGCGSSSLTAQSVSPAAARQEAIVSVKAW